MAACVICSGVGWQVSAAALTSGLGTAELYQAMSTHRLAAQGHAPRGADGNGFVAALNHHGQRVYRPAGGEGRP